MLQARIRILGIALICTVFASSPFLAAQSLPATTALDDYVSRPDPSYRWKIISERTDNGIKTVVIDMVSQKWRTEKDVDRTLWQHWLVLTFPEKTVSDTGFLFISGGSNGGTPPDRADERVASIAQATKTVVAELKMIPNQPLVFHGDGVKRVEDDLIGYTWDQFLKTGDPTWPARNPMVKSAVRAMDTITAATRQMPGVATVKRFVVAGGSKRGWTTWLTGAVDHRVIAISPIVIDVLNVQANTHHHFSAYGFWAPAVGSYVEHGITTRLGHPRMPQLLQLVDPWFYRHRLKMPKLILNASGDQFFPPDSSRYYFDGLLGPKHLRYVPNAEHSLKGTDAVETLIAWYSLILADKRLPRFTWKQREDGALVVRPKDTPRKAVLWQATNPRARDFRLETLGKQYRGTDLTAEPDGSFVAKVPRPAKGWTAYFVELTYDVGLPVPLKLTTTVQVVPDVLPFEGKDLSLPPTITIRCVAPTPQVAEELAQMARAGKLAAIGDEFAVEFRKPTGGEREVNLQVNWKPKGSFEKSAEAVLGWLAKQKCHGVRIRLESGPAPALE